MSLWLARFQLASLVWYIIRLSFSKEIDKITF